MFASLLIFGWCCWSQAEAAEQPEIARRVAALARQLDDDQWARRESAEKALLKMGPDILEWLPHTSPRLSPEMKERLARVRNQLQLAYARQAVEATRVTLQGTMSLSEALGKLQEGNGNRITGYQDLADVRVTINASAVPFWEALDRILDQAQLAIDPYAGVGPACTSCLVGKSRWIDLGGLTTRAHFAWKQRT